MVSTPRPVSAGTRCASRTYWRSRSSRARCRRWRRGWPRILAASPWHRERRRDATWAGGRVQVQPRYLGPGREGPEWRGDRQSCADPGRGHDLRFHGGPIDRMSPPPAITLAYTPSLVLLLFLAATIA